MCNIGVILCGWCAASAHLCHLCPPPPTGGATAQRHQREFSINWCNGARRKWAQGYDASASTKLQRRAHLCQLYRHVECNINYPIGQICYS